MRGMEAEDRERAIGARTYYVVFAYVVDDLEYRD